MISQATALALRNARLAYAPPSELKISEFSDQELMVATGPLQGTRWQTRIAPYQRGIMDAFHEPGVEIVVVMGSSQWGKTAVAVNVVAYHIKHDPCAIQVVEPTVDPMAKDFSKNRLEPVINATPCLREVVSRRRQKDSTNTTLGKTFRGGSLSIGGANSAASLAARSSRLLVLDEVNRYPAELPGEGSTLAIAFKRTTAYRQRRRILMLSSPTVAGGAIDTWFERGDQRHYIVPCIKCGVTQAYTWAMIRWQNRDPRTARIHCTACDYGMNDAERTSVLAAGEWVADNPDREEHTVVSFHMWEAYSPFSTLREIVAGFLRANEKLKTGDRAEMHTWTNTTLGQAIQPDEGDGVEPAGLLMRREEYGQDVDVPAGACLLTMGVDTQDDRLEALVWGWGPGEESWLVDRQVLPGNTEQSEPWDMLDELLDHQYRHASGQMLSIYATCLDTAGHRTTIAYDYALRQSARRVYAIIGRDGERPLVSSPSPRKWGLNKRKVPLYTIGVDSAKSVLLSRMNVHVKGPGFMHLPLTEWADDELADQLTSEKLDKTWTHGIPKSTWRKIRARNEALDCSVYALAALRLVHPNLDDVASKLAASGLPPTEAPRGLPPQRPTKGWLGPKRGGWLRPR